MQEAVERIAAKAGISAELAEKAIGTILGFLRREAHSQELEQMIAAFPGAEDAIKASGEKTGSAGLLGGLGGLMGGGGGLMTLAGELSGIGLGMGEMQAVGKELFAYAREKLGEDAVGSIAGSVPGLHQFI